MVTAKFVRFMIRDLIFRFKDDNLRKMWQPVIEKSIHEP
jgi:hypothetical protein